MKKCLSLGLALAMLVPLLLFMTACGQQVTPQKTDDKAAVTTAPDKAAAETTAAKQSEEKKTEDKKSEDKKSDDKKSEDKKSEDKKSEDKAAETTKAADKKSEDKAAETTKADDKKSEDKAAETTKVDDKKSDKKSDDKKADNKEVSKDVKAYREAVAKFQEMTISEAIEKAQKGDDFVLYIGNEDCSFCCHLAPILAECMDKHKLNVVYVNSSSANDEPFQAFIKEKKLEHIPDIFISKDKDLVLIPFKTPYSLGKLEEALGLK